MQMFQSALTLRKMMTRNSEKANLSIKFTNHSLRAPSASRLFACNIPGKLIQEKLVTEACLAYMTMKVLLQDRKEHYKISQFFYCYAKEES